MGGRPKNPNRQKAKQIWLNHKGKITNRQIAEMLGEKEKTISAWKCRDKWSAVLQNENCSTTDKKCSTTKKKIGAPYGNKNALGNKGGGAPKGNQNAKGHGPPKGSMNALKHGFFRKIFPDDEETMAIVGEIMEKTPLDVLWEQIVIQYTAIARAQKIMYVTNKQEMIKELKKVKSQLDFNPRYNPEEPDSEPFEETYCEEEWEFQFAWDRQATFLTAQSRAMKTLEGLITKYEELVEKYELKGLVVEEHRLRVEKLRAEIKKIGNKEQQVRVIIEDDVRE
ncbi:phage terminase small subunit [Peptococcaceae bacterium 1198_IL3148]